MLSFSRQVSQNLKSTLNRSLLFSPVFAAKRRKIYRKTAKFRKIYAKKRLLFAKKVQALRVCTFLHNFRFSMECIGNVDFCRSV